MGKILLGIIITVLGFLLITYRRQVLGFTGPIDFAESKFPGGTHGFLGVFGIVMVIVGLMVMTGLGDGIVNSITAPFDTLK